MNAIIDGSTSLYNIATEGSEVDVIVAVHSDELYDGMHQAYEGGRDEAPFSQDIKVVNG
jgi:hypothetical protein